MGLAVRSAGRPSLVRARRPDDIRQPSPVRRNSQVYEPPSSKCRPGSLREWIHAAQKFVRPIAVSPRNAPARGAGDQQSDARVGAARCGDSERDDGGLAGQHRDDRVQSRKGNRINLEAGSDLQAGHRARLRTAPPVCPRHRLAAAAPASALFGGCSKHQWQRSGQGVILDRFSPTTPARTRPIDTPLTADTDSPKVAMPTTAVPAAPIPVHTA